MEEEESIGIFQGFPTWGRKGAWWGRELHITYCPNYLCHILEVYLRPKYHLSCDHECNNSKVWKTLYIAMLHLAGYFPPSFIEILLKYNIYKFKMSDVTIWYMYILWNLTTIRLVNTFIPSHNYCFSLAVTACKITLFTTFKYLIEYC